MKTIDVQKQPVLSPGRVLQIAVTGVKYRLFRAIVTVAVIVVAMAFLMNILTESLIKRSVAESVRDQIAELHRVDRWIARLSVPQSGEAIVQALAASADDITVLEELVIFSGYTANELRALQPLAEAAVTYLTFFNELNYGRRRVLVGPVESIRVFDRLQEERHRHTFSTNLAEMRTVRFPATQNEFFDFLDEWSALDDFVKATREGQANAISRIDKTLEGRTITEALRDVDSAFGEQVRAAGFALSPETAAALVRDVEQLDYTLMIEGTINQAGVRQAVAAVRDVLPGDVTTSMIWTMLRQPDRAAWFLEVMRDNELDTRSLTPERLSELAIARAHTRLLLVAERQTMDAGGGFLGIGTRMTWLAMVSMLVCAVGIANAMLMSVTERFREIATLKCLGALDAFIMSVFLIEAGLLGIIGGIGGALAGFVLATLRMGFTFQSLLWPALPWADIGVAAVIAVVVGMFLAAVSAVYPSFRAARLAPMEAMRIE